MFHFPILIVIVIAMSSKPPKKKHKPTPGAALKIIGLKRTSTAALSAILEKVHTGNIQPMSRRVMDDNYHKEYDKIALRLSLPMTDGTAFTWEIANIHQLFDYSISSSPSFASLVFATFKRKRYKPLHLIVHIDAVDFGNPLQAYSQKKVMGISWEHPGIW